MPRAKSDNEVVTEQESVIATKPRKTTARKAVASKSSTTTKSTTAKPVKKKTTRSTTKKTTKTETKNKPTAAKKTASKKSKKQVAEKSVRVEEEVFDTTEVTPTSIASKRKAPTAFADEAARKRSLKIQLTVVAVLLTLGVGASAAVGFTDSGQINVSQTIKDRNERMANLVEVDGPVTVAAAPTLPDGGFVALGDVTPPVSAAVPATTTATTSTASTTQAVDVEDDLPSETASSTINVATTTPTTTASTSRTSDTATTSVEAQDPVESTQ